MTASGSNFESEFFTWLRIFLKDKELQFSQCGFKNRDGLGARHEIDLGSGYWKEPNYSANKPPRWLYHVIPEPGTLRAENPAGGASNLGAINTAQEDKAGVVFRLVPLIQQGPGDFIQNDVFEVHALFVFHGARLCCTNRMRDSSRESSVIAGPHEQTYTPDLQDQELADL